MANTTSKPSLVFFGTGPVSLKTLEDIYPNFTIEAVITKPAVDKSPALVKNWASRNKILVFEPSDKTALDELFKKESFKSSVGLVVDYGLILPRSVLEYFPKGIVNSHFSLLPEWRGADPITFAILSGQPKTGVSLMLIEEQLDTGKLIAQKSLKIDADDTTSVLTTKLIKLSNQMLVEYLPKYLDGQLTVRAQPHPDRATHSRKLTKDDGKIDWTKPAEVLEREVRAYSGWPGSYTKLAGRDVTITKTKVIKKAGKPGEIFDNNDGLGVFCGSDALIIERIKPAGKAEMRGADFKRGYLNRG